jgi:creatinine amidohydrolase
MQDSIYYSDHRWPELKAFAEQGAIVILPVGQTEEHGPHLPVGCDAMISRDTAAQVAAAAQAEMPVLVLPTIWAGYSGKGLFNWPGTISLPPEIVIGTVEHIVVSLSQSGFKKILVMNSHGHHEGILRVAARKIADRCEVTLVLANIWRMAEEIVQEVRESEDGGCNHACEYETSLLLALDKRVDMTLAVDEPVTASSRFVGPDLITRHQAKVFWSTWGHTRSRTGTYGCPTKATAAKGETIMKATVQAFLELLRDMRKA